MLESNQISPKFSFIPLAFYSRTLWLMVSGSTLEMTRQKSDHRLWSSGAIQNFDGVKRGVLEVGERLIRFSNLFFFGFEIDIKCYV